MIQSNLLLSNLQVMAGNDGQFIYTSGRTTAGDKGGGIWVAKVGYTPPTDDPLMGMYVPMVDLSGYWCRQHEGSVFPEAFGASTAPGVDNQPIFKAMMDVQITYSFAETTVHELFDIVLQGMYEIHSPILLSPFIVIRSGANHVQTSTELGYGFNAVGNFTSKAIIDNAPYNIDTTRKQVLYESAGNIYDSGNYRACGNVTLENFLIESDASYNVSTCAFEAIHLCGSNGSIVRNIYTRNTIQGIAAVGGWQNEIVHNKHETYWIGGFFWSNTTSYVRQNYYARTVAQRATVWADVAIRPFYQEIAAGGTSYFAQKNCGIVNIKSGVNFDSNLVEAVDYGFGIDIRPNDWLPRFYNTYMEKIDQAGYIVYTTTSPVIYLGKMSATANLLDVNLFANGVNNNKITIHTAIGAEFVQGHITALGTMNVNGSEGFANLVNFQSSVRPAGSNIYWDRSSVSNGAPTSGRWYVGDTAYAKTPVAGGNIGWVCVTAGDFTGIPPVFKTFGAIAA